MKFTKQQYEEIVLVLENESRFYRDYWNNRFTTSNDTYGKRRAIIGSWLSPTLSSYTKVAWPSWVRDNDIEDRDQIRRYFDGRYGLQQDEPNKYGHIPSVWDEPAPEAQLSPELKEFVKKVVNAGGARKWLATENKGGYTVSLAAHHGYSLRNTDMKPVLAALRIACEEAVTPPSRPLFAPKCPIPIPSPEYLAEWQGSQPQPAQEDTMNKSIEITTKTFANGTDIATMKDADIFALIAEQEAEIEGLKKIKAQPKKLVAEIAKREAGIAALVAYLDKAEPTA